MNPQYIGTFKLSVTRAMREQLMDVLDSLSPVEFSNSAIEGIEQRGGIYQLLLDGQPVYIGKSTSNLRKRLEKHYGKLGGRVGFLIARTTFRCVYVDEDLDALAPEKMLIAAFKSEGKAPWNNNGFGNNDPGRRRDGSLVKENHFDSFFPIDLDLPVTLDFAVDDVSIYAVMNQLKRAIPYNFRFDGPKSAERRELDRLKSGLESPLTLTAGEWFAWIADRLPEGWLITALPGYVICYQEADPKIYGSRRETWLSTGTGKCVSERHEPLYDLPGEIESSEEVD